MKLKSTLCICSLLLVMCTAIGQSQIIKLDSENGSFKNFPILPDNEVFTIEGEIGRDIELVEVLVTEEKSGRDPATYSWNRSEHNLSENFEVIITQPLKASSTYNFKITTFKAIAIDGKKKVLSNIVSRSQHLIKGEVYLDKNTIKVDNGKKLIEGLNQIVVDGISLLRSRNGIEFVELSDLVENDIDKMNKVKINTILRRKKGIEKDSLSKMALKEKTDYLTELILTEIKPFVASELVQQYRTYNITEVKTKKDNFTLPINGGLYAWNLKSNINNIDINNTGLTPGFGITIPFKRTINLNGKSLPSFGLSLGVLTNKMTDSDGHKYATPTINLPMYAALGVNFFKVIRVNMGTLFVTNFDQSPNTFQFIPTLGITFELDAWLGIKK